MKIVKIILEYTPTIFASADCKRLRLQILTQDQQYIVDRIIKDSDIVAFYDLAAKSIVAEMRQILINNETPNRTT